MDRGAWRATVRGVIQSQTRLSNFTQTHTDTHRHTHTHTNGEKECDSTQDQGWGDFDPRSLSHEQDAGGGGLSDPRLGG